MEGTYALLSNLVQTKSIERVLSPIASQVSQLIILNEAYEHGDHSAFPADLVSRARTVHVSADSLVVAANKLLHNAPDQELQLALPQACESLSVAGGGLVTATQRVQMEQYSLESRRHLIRAAKDLLEATLKVLLVADEAEVRVVERAVQALRDRLGVLTAVHSIKNLVLAFKGFSSALVQLTNLIAKRRDQLTDSTHQEQLAVAMEMLRKSVPMLNSSMQTYVKYPTNAQAQGSKDYVVGQVLESIDQLVDALHRRSYLTDEADDDSEQPGHFVSLIDKIVNQLGVGHRVEMVLPGTELDALVEGAVRHSLAVAHMAAQDQREQIMDKCQKVLKQRSCISELAQNVQANPSMTQLADDFKLACECLTRACVSMEQSVAGAGLQLLSDAFKETTEPMERTLRAALCGQQAPAGADVEEFITAFHGHADMMCQVARFIAASSHDPKCVRSICVCMTHLERLDPEWAPAVLVCQREPSNSVALQHLRLLRREWATHVDLLVTSLDQITNPQQFLQISEREMQHEVEICKSSRNIDIAELAEVTRSVIGRARRVSQVTGRVVDSNVDPLFRSGMSVYLSQLNKVIPAVKSAANRVVESPEATTAHESLHKRCGVLLRCVARVREALGGHNLPDLLSPIKDKVVAAALKLHTKDLTEVEKQKPTSLPISSSHALGNDEENEPESEKQLLQHYVVDVVHSQIQDLSQAVTTAAVAGQKKKVNLLCNEVLRRSNHITEAAIAITTCSNDLANKVAVESVSSDITELTPRLLDSARKVAECDTYEVEPMHHCAELWASKVALLEGRVDCIIDRWKQAVDKVCDAAKMANVPLLTAQVRHLNEHKRYLLDIVAAIVKLTQKATVTSAQERAIQLEDRCSEFENLTAMVATIADVLAQSGVGEERQQLEQCCRDWAVTVHCITATVSTLAADGIAALRGEECGLIGDLDDFTVVQREIDLITEQTIRLKSLVDSACESSSDAARVGAAETGLQQLDTLCDHMSECSQLLAHVSTPYSSTEWLYAAPSMALLQWQWAAQVEQVHEMVDTLTASYQTSLNLMSRKANSAANATGSEKDRAVSDFKKYANEMTAKFLQFRSAVLDLVETTQDLEQRNKLRHHLQELTDIMTQIDKEAPVLSELSGSHKSFDLLRRQYAIKCCQLQSALTTSNIEARAITDALRLLKIPPDSHAASQTPITTTVVLSPDHPASVASVLQLPGPVTSTPTTYGGKSILGDLTEISGSLLDFADDLLDDSAQGLMSRDFYNASIDSPPQISRVRYPVVDFEEQSATLWFEEECGVEEQITHNISTNIRILAAPTPSATPVSMTTPSVASRSSYRRRSPPLEGDGAWKKAAATPTRHFTPQASAPGLFAPRRVTFNSPHTPFMDGQLDVTLEAEKWEDDENAIVAVAKEITLLLQHMISFTKGLGPLGNKEQLIDTAKMIAHHGQKLGEFAHILVKYSTDTRISSSLQSSADHIPTVITQLNILASVKTAAPEDRTTEKMLIKTSRNLVSAINTMLRDAEATCVKGIKQPPEDSLDEMEAVVLATRWRRKLTRHRQLEHSQASVDELGLRRVSRQSTGPKLTQILHQR